VSSAEKMRSRQSISAMVCSASDYAFAIFMGAVLSIIFLVLPVQGNNWLGGHGQFCISKEKQWKAP
jgi:hypothetical protein